jgi:hypothetical protein
MNPKIIREELQKLIEKYKLPELDKLDREIEIIDMLSERRELPQDMLTAVRRRFTEVIYSWINFVHSLIIPNPQSIIANKDAEAFNDKEKDVIYQKMAVLTKMTRESSSFEAKKGQPKEEAKFITENFSKFIEMKKDLGEMNEKIIAHWQKEIK